ncbi:MAG TPA: hypothetical protein VHU14_01070 [Solirubrobacterales bacterium]|jgi:hypothetical protein|nr:hypothetical protein [Solirubrobacterales bacterium]
MLKRRLKEPFGKAGLTVAILALVLAMVGGAYAASNSSGGGKATASAKAKKGPRGPKGATGPAGPTGAPGTNGTNGKDGTNGINGTNGKSVVVASFDGENEPAGEPCKEQGGNELEVEGSGIVNYACNGAEGALGTAGTSLPTGAVETGKWVSSVVAGFYVGPISFTVPLAAPLNASHVHLEGESGFSTACLGSEENPTVAANGNLCVYEGYIGSATPAGIFSSFNTINSEEPGASNSGALAVFFEGGGFGSWAVKGG